MRVLLAITVSVLWLSGCRQRPQAPPVFKLLSPPETGITFANTITAKFRSGSGAYIPWSLPAGAWRSFALPNKPMDEMLGQELIREHLGRFEVRERTRGALESVVTSNLDA
jgi:hypothetical protein